MSEYGSSYIPVEANIAVPMNEGPSGEPDAGFEITGNYVNWNSETGVTGRGWEQLIRAPHSPFAGMTSEDIVNDIETSPGHNLNQYFAQLANLSRREQDEFIDVLVQYYGYTDENGGCIGDRLYI